MFFSKYSIPSAEGLVVGAAARLRRASSATIAQVKTRLQNRFICSLFRQKCQASAIIPAPSPVRFSLKPKLHSNPHHGAEICVNLVAHILVIVEVDLLVSSSPKSAE